MIRPAYIYRYYYSEGETPHVLSDTNLQVEAGEFLAVMGPSGSGKSALINLLDFIDKKFEGTYLLEDREIDDFSDKELSRIRNEAVGFVFQDFSLIEVLTVEENVELSLLCSRLTPKEAKGHVHEVLAKVGLPDRDRKHPGQLSGRQQQRTAIACAIVDRPSFIIADEPIGTLNSKTSEEALTLFQQLNNEGVTIILVAHDEEAIEYRNRLIKVRDGKILEEVLI